jgi:3-dehydroquinate synthase
MLCRTLLEHGFTRSDCAVAVGGGVVGDLTGFAAASYMRGIDFYNIPTTVLSQVDSSIGGKVAVNFGGLKNLVGAFYPPKAVLCDPDTLKTLSPRHLAAGLAESVKMAMTFNGEFFRFLEENDPMANLLTVIDRSLQMKQRVVEADEREAGLRKVLNFGHTLAHAIESESQKTSSPLFHGECVALGMLPMCSPEARERLLPVLRRAGLPTECSFDLTAALEAMRHDKKMAGDEIALIRVDTPGTYRMEKLPFSVFAEEVKGWQK